MDLVLEAQPLQSLHTALLCSINSAGLQAWRLKNIPVHLNCLPAWYRVFPPSSYLVVKLWLIIQSRLNKPLILGQISQAEPASEPGGFCSDCKNQNKAHSLFCHEFVYFWIVIMELGYFLLCWRVIWYPLYHWSKCGFASPYLRSLGQGVRLDAAACKCLIVLTAQLWTPRQIFTLSKSLFCSPFLSLTYMGLVPRAANKNCVFPF